MAGGTTPFNPHPPQNQNQNQNNTTPASIFAQMKAGTFAQNDDSTAQSSNKYDALRTNRESTMFVALIAGKHVLTLVCSSGYPAHWMVPWPWCLWILLIPSHYLTRTTFLCSSFSSGHRSLSILDNIDILFIPPHTHIFSRIKSLGLLLMARGYDNENVMIVFVW